MKNWIQSWNAMRIIRLLLGIAIIYQAFVMHENMMLVAGILLTLLPIANIGCAGGNCSSGYTNRTQPTTLPKDVTYEEVDR